MNESLQDSGSTEKANRSPAAPVKRKARRRWRRSTPEKKSCAVRAFRNPEISLSEIALSLGVTIATISIWASAAGEPHRRRGRRKLTVPTEKQLGILHALKSFSMGAVARQYGLSKSRVWSIARRWQHLGGTRELVSSSPSAKLQP